ncbi:MAG: ABC transporter substrate-binding protein [Rhodospirillaceae bacterium]|nr:ABC transporter substrate-binding protein [Rhodospirillaceae bacterium]
MMIKLSNKIFLFLTIVIFSFSVASYSQAEKPSVLFINPGKTGEVFWDMVSNFMMAAAHDLNLDAKIVYAERDHLKMIDLAKEAVQSDSPPNYMILVNEKLAAGRMLDEIPPSIKIVLLNNTLSVEQINRYGKPRQMVPNWIAHIYPNHEKAGYDIAQSIISAQQSSKQLKSIKKIGLLAIGGSRATTASSLRLSGLQRALREYPNVELQQTIHSQWRRDKAESQIYGLIRRWPDTQLIWAANDPMALGAIDAVIKRNKRPGENIFVGGLNWSTEALEKIVNGTMVTSIGGHFMQGAWAMVLIHDYHKGLDFEDLGFEFTAPMTVIDQTNVARYLEIFGDQNWDKIDFKKFSRWENKPQKIYQFQLTKILNQFRKQ